MLKYYTGVGSRKTPTEILELMKCIAIRLANRGFVLRSGGADGADKAFEAGCNIVNGSKEIFYARDCTAEAKEIAKEYHPAWYACSEYAQKLHGRNAFQVLGRDLQTPSTLLICWTPDGCTSHSERQRITGGTGTAISIANAYGVRIHNLANEITRTSWKSFVDGGNI